MLWLAGGVASTDTFDPKRYTPYEKGLDPNKVLSTFPSIDTVVDGLKFTEGLEKIGGVMDRGTLIKTYRAADHVRDRACCMRTPTFTLRCAT